MRIHDSAQRTALAFNAVRSTLSKLSRAHPRQGAAALGWWVRRINPLDETVVPCHSNQERHGKAGNLKAKNEFTVPGCMWCHAWIDQNRVGTPRQIKFEVWDRAFEEWAPVRARKMGEANCQ